MFSDLINSKYAKDKRKKNQLLRRKKDERNNKNAAVL